LRPGSALCLGLREGRHDVGHFGNTTGRGAFTDAGQLAVITCLRTQRPVAIYLCESAAL